jgi:hypothetical protein
LGKLHRDLTLLSIPAPSATQKDPFQSAIRFALTPPELENEPAATMLPFDKMDKAMIVPSTPDPSGAQPDPFHTAILLTLTPPAEVNPPPVTSIPLARAANANI